MRRFAMLSLLSAALIGLGGCEADEEAIDPAVLEENPAIEEAPVAPIDAGGIPIGNEPMEEVPGTADTVNMDTIGMDTLR